jgi:hypothetical protein
MAGIGQAAGIGLVAYPPPGEEQGEGDHAAADRDRQALQGQGYEEDGGGKRRDNRKTSTPAARTKAATVEIRFSQFTPSVPS